MERRDRQGKFVLGDIPAACGLQRGRRVLASASEDKTVRVWDVAPASNESSFGHDSFAKVVRFADDAKSSYLRGRQTTRIWDVSTVSSLPRPLTAQTKMN